MQNRKRDTDVQNSLLDSVGEGEGGMFQENTYLYGLNFIWVQFVAPQNNYRDNIKYHYKYNNDEPV